jgi:hypothetical protein
VVEELEGAGLTVSGHFYPYGDLDDRKFGAAIFRRRVIVPVGVPVIISELRNYYA